VALLQYLANMGTQIRLIPRNLHAWYDLYRETGRSIKGSTGKATEACDSGFLLNPQYDTVYTLFQREGSFFHTLILRINKRNVSTVQ
jgi:hypothetical protein